jgi:UDP-2-acetamido-2,6-beta-L-arabino-hexul-4-ose reductase
LIQRSSVLVTGANGFIGKNLIVNLNTEDGFTVLQYSRDNSVDELDDLVEQSDAVFHLAGENRPIDPVEFDEVNAALTQRLCSAIRKTGRKIPLVLASSTQAEKNNPDNHYGRSKYAAEEAVKKLAIESSNPVYIYRLPGVFGKWCKPNYNSVVATFCHNIANDLPIQIDDDSAELNIVYIDDVVEDFISVIQKSLAGVLREDVSRPEIVPLYTITLGELATQIKAFKNCRDNLVSEAVGQGVVRALYSTYVSYLSPEQFSYALPRHGDERGLFVEMLKTKESGQFSFFTMHTGVTRGGHYHNSKTEKFLVLKGSARFKFRHMVTHEIYEMFTNGDESVVVDTVPGWTHNITNVGDEEMIVMIWANEIFDHNRPDTIAAEI